MNDMIVRYMRACVRANAPRDLHAWTPDELADVFSAIPQPARSLPEWVGFREALDPADAPAGEVQLTDEQRDANQNFIDLVAQMKKKTLADA